MPRLGSQQLSRSQLSNTSTWDRSLDVGGGKGDQTTVVAQYTDVLSDGLETIDISFDNNRGAFITEWINEERWASTNTLAVRIVSSVETQPIHLQVERDDTDDGTPDETSGWIEVTADDTPVQFPNVDSGEGTYRVLLRYIRPSDFVRDIDIGFVR